MQISRLLFERMVTLFASASNALMDKDTGENIRIKPVNVAFTPGLDRVFADVPVQTTLLNTPIEVYPDQVPQFYTDKLTGERVAEFQLLNNAGSWIQSADGTFTIHGTRLESFDGLTLLATELLEAPVPFAKAGDGCQSPRIEFRFPPSMVR